MDSPVVGKNNKQNTTHFLALMRQPLSTPVSHMKISTVGQLQWEIFVFLVLVWPTQLDPAFRTLFVCVCFCVSTSRHRTSSYVIT